MSQLKTNSIVDASGGNTATINGVAPNVNNIRGKNKVINGAMQVAQRGTTFTGFADQDYTLDRFYMTKGGVLEGYVGNVTQESDAPAGFSTSLKVQTTTAEPSFETTESIELCHNIEAQNLQDLDYGTANAKTMTLSFWCKCNKTGTQSIHVRAHDAGHGYSAGYTINAADTWEYKTITISGNTTGSITNDNGIGLWIRWVLADGDTAVTEDAWDTTNTGPYAVSGAMTWGTSTSDYFQITGVQLEVGDTASGFEHLSYGETLALCQRYFFAMGGNDIYERFGWGHATAATTLNAIIKYPVRMRGLPSISVSAASDFAAYFSVSLRTASAFAIDRNGLDYLTVTVTVDTGLVQGDFAQLAANNTTNARMYVDAEL